MKRRPEGTAFCCGDSYRVQCDDCPMKEWEMVQPSNKPVDYADAGLFASQILKDADRQDFYGFKLSMPSERVANLARAFLSSPKWLAGLSSNPEEPKEKPKVYGRAGKAIRVKGKDFKSIAEACREFEVHKSVINRWLMEEKG